MELGAGVMGEARTGFPAPASGRVYQLCLELPGKLHVSSSGCLSPSRTESRLDK